MSVGTLTRPLLGLMVSVLLIGAVAIVAPGTASAAGGGTVRGHVQDQSAVALNNSAWLLATCADAKLRDPSRAVTVRKSAPLMVASDTR